ncbi:MAG: 23S rRNA (pseudouridine(1915)-N(3))-methyltransferase RlmH [Pseudomonadales bacterium]
MRIRLLGVGTRMPSWVRDGFHEYTKRLPRGNRLELVEIPLGDRRKGALAHEGRRMLDAVGKEDTLIALDERGERWSTRELAERLEHWRAQGRDVSLLVGGPDGLHQSCLEGAHETWSLSPLTFPHYLVRVLVAEQIYRAWSVVTRHPYHRD